MPRLNQGQPSGTNKSEGSGVPNKIPPEDGLVTDRQTDQYTNDEGELDENVRVLHPNRKVDKDLDSGPPYS